jgi:hypothetical protein
MTNYPYLIPGEGPGPNPYQPLPRPPRSSLLKVVIAVWLLAGAGFVTWKLGFATSKPAATTPVIEPSPTAISPIAISAEDLLHHTDAVNRKLTEATARLRRAEDQISRTLPSMDRNYLLVERQQLQNALSATEAARRDLEQAREDTNLILNSLKKEHELE